MFLKERLTVFIGALALLLPAGVNHTTAAFIIPPQDQSQVDVSTQTGVQFDPATGLYTYSFTVTNGPTAAQEVATFAIEADVEIVNVQSPQGWTFGFVFDKPILLWDATGFLDDTIPPEEDDGNIFPSPFNIDPGETLAGFSFQSPAGPTTVMFFAQGFAKLPVAESEDDFGEIELPTFDENSQIGFTTGPGLDDNIIFTGGRRPSVDGFLGFVGLAGDRETLPRPVTMVVRFGVNGETVDTSTFLAELNMVAVTGSFTPTGNADELLAVFDLADSPLVIGRNVLATSIEGTVPGTTRTAADTDRLTFFVD